MIGDVIYLILYLLTEVINYLCAYVIIFQAGLCKNKRRWILCGTIVLTIHLIAMYYGDVGFSESISFLTMIAVPGVLLGTREKKWFLLYPVVVMGTSVIAVSSTFLLALLANMPEYLLTEDDWLVLLCQSIPLLIMFVVYVHRKIRRCSLIQIQLSAQQYILFYIGISCTFILLASIQVFSKEDFNNKLINVYGFAVSLSCIIFVMMSLWQGVVIYREVQYKKQNEMYEKYMKMQADYFYQIIEQDEKMRRFRHDMNAHIIALKSYCENGCNDELEKYLESMIENSAVFEAQSYTGNRGIDAVIRHLMDEAERKQIHMKIQGNLPKKLEVSVYDLCTIMSNLINNAVEACEKIDNIQKRKIEIQICSYYTQIFIMVKNTVQQEVVLKNNHLVTSKSDTRNHGLGSGNIQKTVKKYNGSLEYKCEEGWFKAEIYI